MKKKIMAEIVATTSLPVDRLTATDCNAAARANITDFIHICAVRVLTARVEISDQQIIRIIFMLVFSQV